jgi:hypothetical protein
MAAWNRKSAFPRKRESIFLEAAAAKSRRIPGSSLRAAPE